MVSFLCEVISSLRYLAFDIEAANGYKAYSICSIGIVIADEQFNILEKRNIWINPKCKYNLNGTRDNIGINLNLDKEVIKSSPTFPQVYDEIKAYLTDPNNIIVGHAVDSDVIMLNAACRHYKLPCINFNFICSQLLFKMHKGDKEVRALGKIAAEIGVEFTAHNSDEDAYVTMLTLKYLTEQTNLTIDELLKKFNVRIGSNNHFELIRSVSLTGQISKRSISKEALINITKYKDSRVAAKTKETDILKDKVFAFSRDVEIKEFDLIKQFIDYIYKNGGSYTTKASKCNVYVEGKVFSNTEKLRFNYVKQQIEAGREINIINLENFLEEVKANV